MWVVSLEKQEGVPTTQVIDVKTIFRAAHLIPVFGSENVPSDVYHYNSLDIYRPSLSTNTLIITLTNC